MPIAFELAELLGERQVAAEMLARVNFNGYTVIADKGFAGRGFEQLMHEFGAIFMRPDREDETAWFGAFGTIRQWIESVFDTLKGQLSLKHHGAVTMPGLITTSPSDGSPSPPASGTTRTSANPAAASPYDH